MYAVGNPKTKKKLNEWVATGRKVEVFQPGGMFEGTKNGSVCVEMPQYPQPHRSYATCVIKDGIILSVK
jgi:hypothetical protein